MSGRPSGPPSGAGDYGGGEPGDGSSRGRGGYGGGVGGGLIAAGAIAGILTVGFLIAIGFVLWHDKRSSKKQAARTNSSKENLEAYNYFSNDGAHPAQMRNIATGQVVPNGAEMHHGNASDSGDSNLTALPPSPGLRGLGSMMRRKEASAAPGIHPVARGGTLGSQARPAPPQYTDESPMQRVELAS